MSLPQLHHIFSPDLNDPAVDSPADVTNFMIRIQALIGIDGDDTFVFYVCTPKYLSETIHDGDYLLTRHYLIVHHYDYDLIKKAIENIIATTKTPDGGWETQARRLAGFGEWEYE